jgi:PAS domain S-box-containing protein
MTWTTSGDPRWEQRFRRASAVLSAGVSVLGLLVLIGWGFDITVLKRVHPSFSTMKANTALLFVILGIGLSLSRSDNAQLRRTRRILGLVVIIPAAATLTEYLLGVSFGIDELLFPDPLTRRYPGRMSEASGANFVLLGLALCLGDGRWQLFAGRFAALLATADSLISFCGYLYGVTPLHAVGPHRLVAIHTALGFLAASSAFLLARPTQGLVLVFASDTNTGRLLRRVLPAVVLVPIAFGRLCVQGELAGFYDVHFGFVLMVLVTMIALSTFTSGVALPSYRAEIRARDALRHLASSEQRFRALVEASAQIVWTADAGGERYEDSPSWRAFTGRTYEQLRGLGWLDAVHPEDRERVIRVWQDAARSMTQFAVEYRKRHRSGEWRWVSVRGVPLCDQDRSLYGWVGMDSDVTERKRAEAERERQIREIVEHAPQAIAMFDRNMRYREASPRWLRDYGLSADFIGKSQYEVFPEVPAHWIAVHQRCLAGATEQNDGERFVRQDGSVQWVRWKVCPWKDADGAIGGLLIYAEEITRQREAEELSRANEHRLRLAQQVARIGTFEWNIQTGLNTWTPELEAMYGLPVGAFGRTQPSWEQLVHPDDRARAVQRVDEALETGAPTEDEWRVVWPDGSVHWIAGRFQAFKDDAGKPSRLVGTNIEITERKRAEVERENLLREIRDLSKGLELRVEQRTKELAVAKDRLDGVISLAADAIVSVGEDQRITIFNRAAEEIFRWTRDEILGKPLDVLIPERFRTAHHEHIASFAKESTKARRMADGRPVFARRKDGEEFPVEAAISKLQTDSGFLFTVILRDITEQSRYEAEQARTYAERAVLLKEVHHRVKNNLQVLSSLFYLQAQQTDQPKIRTLLEESRGRIQSIALIHEKLYRSEHLARIDFGDYLKDLTRSLMGAIGVQAPNVSTSVEATNVFVDIERAIPCALIVNELVSNAMKHAFPGGRSGEVCVRVRSVDSGLELEVSDNGIGFPLGLDLSSVSTLGLQLVVSLTQQLRGTLELGREGGTTVRVRFPLSGSTEAGQELVKAREGY